MEAQKIDDIIEFLTRSELQAFTITNAKNSEKYDAYTSDKNTAETVERFREITQKLPSGSYKITAWKIGGQASPYTRFFAIGNSTTPNAGAMAIGEENVFYRMGVLETRLAMQQEMAVLHRKFEQKAQLKPKTKPQQGNPIINLVLSKLIESPIIQSKFAQLVDTKEGQEFILRLTGQKIEDEEEDEDDEEEDEDDEEENQ